MILIGEIMFNLRIANKNIHINHVDIVKLLLLLFCIVIGTQGITIIHTIQLIRYVGKVVVYLLGAS